MNLFLQFFEGSDLRHSNISTAIQPMASHSSVTLRTADLPQSTTSTRLRHSQRTPVTTSLQERLENLARSRRWDTESFKGKLTEVKQLPIGRHNLRIARKKRVVARLTKKLKEYEKEIEMMNSQIMDPPEKKARTTGSWETQKRSHYGSFIKRCGAAGHKEGVPGSQILISLVGRRIRKAAINHLIEKNIITSRTTSICKECLDREVDYTSIPETSQNKRKRKSTSDQILEPQPTARSTRSHQVLDWQTASETEPTLKKTSFSLPELEYDSMNASFRQSDSDDASESGPFIDIGAAIGSAIADDVAKLSGTENYKNIDYLQNYNAKEWLSERPKDLISLLSEVCQVDTKNDEDEQRLIVLCKVIELMYYLRNPQFVLPVSFRENLVKYTTTNPKQIVEMNAKSSPGGSNKYISKWLENQAFKPVTYPPGLAKSVFNCSQMVQKTQKILGSNNVITSRMTNHLTIGYDDKDKSQFKTALSPRRWMWPKQETQSALTVISKMLHIDGSFRSTRNSHIEDCLSIISQQLRHDGEDYIDHISKKLEQSSSDKICPVCGLVNSATHRICKGCGASVVCQTFQDWSEPGEPDTPLEPYDGFSDMEAHVPSMMCQQEDPDFLNANTFENINKIVQNIRKRSGTGQNEDGNREWLFLECSDLTYLSLRAVMDNVWTCEKCNVFSVYGRKNIADHSCGPQTDVPAPPRGKREFGWVVPIVGLQHFEKNAARAFLNLNWFVFGKEVATVLGYKTSKSQELLQKVCDYEELWNFLEVLYMALSLELLIPYLKECSKRNTTPTVDGYWEWCNTVADHNYGYVQQMTFSYLHALMMLRTGVRRCNAPAVRNAKARLALLFYARMHPNYQEILFREALDDVNMPEEIRKIKEKYISGTRTGDPGGFQAGDALLNDFNEESKKWLKHGEAPTEKEWKCVFGNLHKLNEIKENALHPHGSSDDECFCEESMIKEPKMSEVNKVRALLRRKSYLKKPKEPKGLVSLDGKTFLNPHLVNISVKAREIATQDIQARLRGESLVKTIIHVTEKEKEDMDKVRSASKKTLKEKIYRLMQGMDSQDAILEEEYFKRKVEPRGKNEYVNFYYQLVQDLPPA